MLHIVPFTNSQDPDTITCVSFNSDFRDAATLVHSYINSCPALTGVILTRNSRSAILLASDWQLHGPEVITNAVHSLFTSRRV